MDLALDVLGWTLILTGGAFGIIGGIGILRMPDFFTRIHAAGMAETMCAPPILLGLALQADGVVTLAKLFAIFLFLMFTSPTASHALAKAALHGGVKPQLAEDGEA